jgi:RNA polymerase sigma factor for flagellar operon FliA
MKSSTAFASREREQSILDHLPQVRMLARQLHRRCPSSVLFEDLVSAGVTGLIEAADRYDRRRNVKFQTLAGHRIRGAMFDYLRSLDPLPRAVRRFSRDRDTAIAHLENGRDASPSEEEIAAKMGVSLKRYRRLSQTVHEAGVTVSLDQFDGFAVSGDAQHHESEWNRELDDAINALPLRWRSVILSLRDGYTLDEIAAGFGITEGRVSQIKKQAIIRLRIVLGITAGSLVHHSTCKAQATERAL